MLRLVILLAVISYIVGVPLLQFDSSDSEENPELNEVLPIRTKQFKQVTRSSVPGEALSPDEFQKAALLTKPKSGAVDPNDPTNEDIMEPNKQWQSTKEVRQKNVVEQWEKARVPYLIDRDFDEDQRIDIAKAVQDFEDETCIQFVAADVEKDEDYVFIENSDGGCKSPIGHKGGRQVIRLADNCFDQFGRLLHEMMHTLGFVHEQSRSDRDKFVYVDYDVIKEEYEHNFEKRDPPAGNYAGEYDTRSVLHYSAHAFADPKSEITIFPYFDETENLGQRDTFSKMDIEKMNKWYKCKPKRQTKKAARIPCEKAGDNCKNNHANCTTWAEQDHCNGERNGWMTANCRLACNRCGEICEDLNEKCGEWAERGFCEEYDDFMIPYCPRSCKNAGQLKIRSHQQDEFDDDDEKS